jgi:hypothetical protein
MDSALEDRFVVFIRADRDNNSSPYAVELPLASCASYAEAKRLRDAVNDHSGNCVIRFVGETGGGD